MTHITYDMPSAAEIAELERKARAMQAQAVREMLVALFHAPSRLAHLFQRSARA